jgi:hypothetical protein
VDEYIDETGVRRYRVSLGYHGVVDLSIQEFSDLQEAVRFLL